MGVSQHDAALLANIRSRSLEVLRECLPPGTKGPIHYLDAPSHRNFGDSLIWQGAMEYLKELGHRVAGTVDLFRGDAETLKSMDDPDVTILLQGGGNLGDLYPQIEMFRREVVSKFRKRRVIIMPQTIYFRSAYAMRDSVNVYRQAENLTLLLRDTRSVRIAAEHFKGVNWLYCPDLAYGMTPWVGYQPEGSGATVLQRADKESKVEGASQISGAVDWNASTLNGLGWQLALRAKGWSRRVSSHPVLIGTRSLPYHAIRWLNVAAAQRQLRNAGALATDRMHAHILATLMGIPHAVWDNSYGKISQIFRDYSGDFESAHWAESPTDAVRIAEGLV